MTLEELRAFFANDRFATALCGIEVEDARDGYARCGMTLTPEHRNANGYAQGGAIFTLCDTTFAVAANAGEVSTVSLGSQITFCKPGTGSRLTAVATAQAVTRKTSLYEVKVYDDANELVALATVNGYRKG